MKNEYITEINNYLNLADIELLDFVLQILRKSVDDPVTPSETHQQLA